MRMSECLGIPQHNCCGPIEAAAIASPDGRMPGIPQHNCCGPIEAEFLGGNGVDTESVFRSITAAAPLKLVHAIGGIKSPSCIPQHNCCGPIETDGMVPVTDNERRGFIRRCGLATGKLKIFRSCQYHVYLPGMKLFVGVFEVAVGNVCVYLGS